MWGSWGTEGTRLSTANPIPSCSCILLPGREGPWHSHRQHRRLQLQRLILRLWWVLQFCVTFLGIDFGRVSFLCPSCGPRACDLENHNCHSFNYRSTIILKNMKYLHPKNENFLPICHQNCKLLGLRCQNPAQVWSRMWTPGKQEFIQKTQSHGRFSRLRLWARGLLLGGLCVFQYDVTIYCLLDVSIPLTHWNSEFTLPTLLIFKTSTAFER